MAPVEVGCDVLEATKRPPDHSHSCSTTQQRATRQAQTPGTDHPVGSRQGGANLRDQPGQHSPYVKKRLSHSPG